MSPALESTRSALAASEARSKSAEAEVNRLYRERLLPVEAQLAEANYDRRELASHWQAEIEAHKRTEAQLAAVRGYAFATLADSTYTLKGPAAQRVREIVTGVAPGTSNDDMRALLPAPSPGAQPSRGLTEMRDVLDYVAPSPAEPEPRADDDDTLFMSHAQLRARVELAEARLAEACDQIQSLRAALRAAEAQLEAVHALLARIVKYAREDRACTPGVTRLARALSEAKALLTPAETESHD